MRKPLKWTRWILDSRFHPVDRKVGGVVGGVAAVGAVVFEFPGRHPRRYRLAPDHS